MLELIQRLDNLSLLYIQEHMRIAALNSPIIFLGKLGNLGLFWIILAIILLCIPKTRKMGVLALCSLLACYLVNNIILKNLIARPRPYTQLETLVMLIKCPSDASFPSGHACSSFACSGALIRSAHGTAKIALIPALLLALCIALSRLYVGVHYPSDVLAGSLIGLIGSGLIVRYLSKPYEYLCAVINQRHLRNR